MESNSNEELLRNTIDSSPDMIQVFKAVRNDVGEIVDFIWILNNRAAENIYGDIIGQRLLTLNPGVMEAGIFATFKKVVETGVPDQSVKHYVHEQFSGWFYQSTVKQDDGIATTTRDITDIKTAEREKSEDIIELKRRERQREFLLNFSDTLRVLQDEQSIKEQTVKMVAGHLDLDRCWISEVFGEQAFSTVGPEYFSPGLTPLSGVFRVSDNPEIIRQLLMHPMQTSDTLNDAGFTEAEKELLAAFHVQSLLVVPLHRGEFQVIWALAVAMATPRQWTADERILLENIAERTWAAVERSRVEKALRESEGRLAADLVVMQRLYNLYATLATSLDLKSALNEILAVACEITNTDRGSIQLISKEGTHLEMFTWRGYSDDSPFIKYFRNEVFREGRDHQLGSHHRMIIEETIGFPGLKGTGAGAAIYADGIRALQSTPIVNRRNEVIGVLSTQFLQPHHPGEDALRLIDLLTWTAADFVERYHAHTALRESEARLRTLANAVPQIIWTNTPDGEATYFNRRWYDYSGLSYEESRGPGWQVIVHPEDAPVAKELWQNALAENIPFDTEYRLRRVDGTYRWFICRNIPLKNSLGLVTSWFGSATDIHDLKIAEEALSASRERLRVTLESAVEYAIITTDVNGFIEGWNKGAENIFGYREEEVTGHSASFIFTPEDRAAGEPQKEMEKALQNGRAEDERWHLRRDGARIYVSGVTSPINHGQLTGYVKVARDMTGQKESEERLRVSEERYRIALQSADMAAWDWNVTEDLIQWNDQHFLLLGLQPEDRLLNAGYFLQFIHPDDLPSVKKELKHAMEETGLYRAEAFRIIRADGEVRWMSGFGRTVEWKDGRSARMVGVMFDITERMLLEQQKEQFIAIASHELRTPVTSIKAYTEILEEMFTEKGDMDSAGLMRKMDVQVDRLTSLIYALLDSTRVTEGKLQLQKLDFRIDALIADTVETMQRIAGSPKIELELEANVTVNADEERIRQVLTNLISNAIKYAPNTERIIVRSEAAEDAVTVCVQDFGIGMSEETQGRLFEPFFRSQEVSNFSGLGLGLFISAGVVRQHGGSFSVESRKGEGSTFCFRLPLVGE